MRRVRRKGASKEKVFACDLLEHLNATGQEIPQVLRCCCQFVEEHGVVDGIYRLSGVSSNIQKLRSEFESDGTPDLSKEVYLQDIHCVSSLCKAYFRELPNPLLTYQLYDKFAEAVAIHLEDERLVKIRDVLKELPPPHYRTLEFLMRHLVKMASYSSETNMHARNLAIVWAPNLLRCGRHTTSSTSTMRLEIEWIICQICSLRSKDIEVSGFNGTAAFMEVRVQSIVVEFILTHVPELFPEPTMAHNRRKSLPSPTAVTGQEEALFQTRPHISPGDGPIPTRPYHAIIEGTTDKRKGSFKGRKWISIFNIGSRFHDPRRRHKHSAKEKDKPVLRPARSMDSLSVSTYSNEDSIRPLQTTRSAKMSVFEHAASPSPFGGSEYAVTYRRGTGLVSGGTQGTYTTLHPEGSGGPEGDSVQSRSPGLSAKAGRRAAMHITGPTVVTVPLHITSNLALGLLQGGGTGRVVHRGKGKDGGQDSGKMEMPVEVREESKEVTHRKEIILDDDNTKNPVDKEEEEDENKEALGKDRSSEPAAKESKRTSYKAGVPSANVLDSSGVLNSTEDDQELSGYVEDNFEFLDHMDCSDSDQIPLHFLSDCASQANVFSVEPPGHSDDEYELAEEPCHRANEADARLSVSSETNLQSRPELQRPRSVNERNAKSFSLPRMTSPAYEPGECCCDDTGDEDTANYYSSDEDSSLFVKSLPADFFLNHVCGLEPEDESAPVDRSCEANQYNPTNDDNQSQDDLDGLEEMIPQSEEQIHYCVDLQEHISVVKANEDDDVDNVRREDEGEAHYLSTFERSTKKETCPVEEFLDVSQEATEELQDDGDESQRTEDVNPETMSTDDGEVPNLEGTREDVLATDETHAEVWDELEEVVCQLIENEERKTVEASESPGTDELETTAGKDLPEVHLPARCDQLVAELMPKEDKSIGEASLKGDRADESAGGGNFDKGGPERCEKVMELLLPNEDKAILEKVTVTPSRRDEPLTENDGMIENQEKCKPEGAVMEMSAPTDKFGICEEVTPSHFTDVPMVLQSRGVSFDEQGHNGAVAEMSVPKEDKPICEEATVTTSLKELRSHVPESTEGVRLEERGVGRKLVISKLTKVYQVKAVPVVPPKPQHCKLATRSLRQQQQQRERRDGDAPDDVGATCGRDASRNSPLSMCFDEAVAKAIMRREKNGSDSAN
ncbi:rho GTPase-activating protein 30 isoform X3 [Syngnathus acus]|uniref:rho GTPase-activating protein 30 isoform X3 n=1 Tax=Syngnathus acus TaxID=161584 RepID=UPI0018864084|nr:rho GTPase-activating protein 30 isoform X3 [Syngnathus acus]